MMEYAHKPVRQWEEVAMELPHWVEEDLELLPNEFTGQIIIEVWEGGVTRRDIVSRRQAPTIAAETLPREI